MLKISQIISPESFLFLYTNLTYNIFASKHIFNKNDQKYYDKNIKYVNEKCLYIGKDYDSTMETLSKSGVYISTWNGESFGITALEALSRGVPLIMFKNRQDTHASIEITTNNNQYILLDKKCSKEEFTEAVNKLKNISYQEKLDISNSIKEKHSKSNWVSNIENAIQLCIDSKERVSSLEDLF